MKDNNNSLNLLDDDLIFNTTDKLMYDVLICPWCYNMTTLNKNDDEVLICEVCQRIITEGDIENEFL